MYDVLMVEQDALFGEQPPADGFQAQVLSRWRSVCILAGFQNPYYVLYGVSNPQSRSPVYLCPFALGG